jgi:UDP-glucose 4-epimerase
MAELAERFPNVTAVPIIGDVRDRERMRLIFERYRPYAVFHAAAHKHVPLMEENMAEAVTNNVLGTKNIAELSAEFEVETQSFFCECSRPGCRDMIDVSAEVYGRVRSTPSHYLIRSGHQDPTQEEILEDFGEYLIVQAQPAVVGRTSPVIVSQG